MTKEEFCTWFAVNVRERAENLAAARPEMDEVQAAVVALMEQTAEALWEFQQSK